MTDDIKKTENEANREDVLNSEEVRSFVTYLCAKIRIALENITRTTDELFDAVSLGTINGEQITDGLNKIDRSIMSVAREVIQQEQLYSMLDTKGRTAVLSMSDELMGVIRDIKDYLGSSVTVTGECPENIRFRMDHSLFRSVVAEMTAECCSSELFPDLLVYAVKRTDENRAELTVRSINTSGEPNTAYDFAPREADIRGIDRHVFFENVQSVMEEMYGAVFSCSRLPDGILYKMDLEILSRDSSPIAMSPAGYLSEEDSRFGAVQMALADFCHTERYHYVDLSRIDDNTDYENNQKQRKGL